MTFVDFIFFCTMMLAGGWCLGAGVEYLKKGHYFVFGISVMAAISIAASMIKIVW